MSTPFRMSVAVAALLAGAAMPAQAFLQYSAANVVCQLASTTDLTLPSHQVGVVTGAVVKSRPGTLRCEVRVNGVAAGSAGEHTVGAGTAHVAVVAGALRYFALPSDYVTVCAKFDPDNGEVEWWEVGSTLGQGSWQPLPVDPSKCALVTEGFDMNAAVCPVLLAIDARLATPLADIWQDCEPYSRII